MKAGTSSGVACLLFVGSQVVGEFVKSSEPIADEGCMREAKVSAAKRLIDALECDLDFDLYFDAHPLEESAMEKMEQDIGDLSDSRHRGVPHNEEKSDYLITGA